MMLWETHSISSLSSSGEADLPPSWLAGADWLALSHFIPPHPGKEIVPLSMSYYKSKAGLYFVMGCD